MTRFTYFYGILLMHLLLAAAPAGAQRLHISGMIRDLQNDEPVPFASVQFLKSGVGTLADSAGNFSFLVNDFSPDSLTVTSVGFKRFAAFINTKKDTFRFV